MRDEATGSEPMWLADGRTFALDLDEPPLPEVGNRHALTPLRALGRYLCANPVIHACVHVDQ